jgi:hypothetical protein
MRHLRPNHTMSTRHTALVVRRSRAKPLSPPSKPIGTKRALPIERRSALARAALRSNPSRSVTRTGPSSPEQNEQERSQLIARFKELQSELEEKQAQLEALQASGSRWSAQ